MIAFYLAIAVFLITILAYTLLGRTIDKVSDAANNHPKTLRGVSVSDALAKVEEWKKARDGLWTKAVIVIVGLILVGVFWK
jgi:Na+/H+ antiporter NhaC